MFRLFSKFLVVAALVCCCSCGDTAGIESPDGTLTVETDIPQTQFPAPADLKNLTSIAYPGLRGRSGSSFEYEPGLYNLVNRDVIGGHFRPMWNEGEANTLETTAFGIYRFTLPDYNDPPLIRLSQSGFYHENLLWLGLSRFEDNAWNWINIDPANFTGEEYVLELESLAPFFDNSGNLYVAVAACGSGYWDFFLHWIVIGGNLPPTLDINCVPQSGPVPLVVNFYTHPYAGDLDGELVNMEWDFESDGNWDLSGMHNFDFQHIYETPGDYECILRVTDNDGATGTTSVSITVTE